MTTVLTHGCYDLLHPGHLAHLEEARRLGDRLVVSVTSDRFVREQKGPGRPIFDQDRRMAMLRALRLVDEVILSDADSAVEVIRAVRPSLYVKGVDYTGRTDPRLEAERQAVESVGGRLVFTQAPKAASSTTLVSHLPIARVREALDRIQPLKVLVVGEAIRDVYVSVTPMGMTPKDVLVAWHEESTETMDGGATACANHLDGFCQMVGQCSQLTPATKRRYVWGPWIAKVFAVQQVALKAEEVEDFADRLPIYVRNYDCVIVTDYGHGLLTPSAITTLAEQARFLAVNTQANAGNFGFHTITKYPRADYVCLDEMEARLALQDRVTPLPEVAAKLRGQLGAGTIAITRGHLGSLVLDADGITEAPAMTDHVVDRIGAGDAYLALTAPCVAVGVPRETVALLGNAIGALAVGTVGNRTPVTRAALEAFVEGRG